MFKPGDIYHIVNQGNDQRTLFHNEENYGFFLRKVEKQFEGIGEIIAYCLMPNHFHLLVLVTEKGCEPSRAQVPQAKKNGVNEQAIIQELSHSLKKLQMGYAKSYNKFYRRSGSLFRQHAKYAFVCHQSDVVNGLPPSYLKNCFTYIHENPVRANLCNHPSEWTYSSYLEFTYPEHTGICNLELAKKLGLEVVA